MTDPLALSRRRLLAAGAATGAGVLLGGIDASAKPATATSTRKPKRVDVVVVGAGLAGLTAARELVKAGTSVVLLEASSRVGGRTLNHDLGDGQAVEVGGQFVGPTQDHILELARQVDVKTFPGYRDGPTAYIANGQVTRYNAGGPLGDIPPDPAVLPDLAQLVTRIDQMSRAVPPDAPWAAPDAGGLDEHTVASWLRANSINQQGSIETIDLFFNSFYGNRTGDVGFLFFLGQIAGMGNERTPGTLERGLASKGGAQESRFVGGSQLVSIKVAEGLGRRVVLRAPVRRIEQRGTRATVVSDRGTWLANRVIVAIPPPMVNEIRWDPVLPVRHDAVRRRMPLGTLAKVHAVYDEPFWRHDTGTWRAVNVGGVVKEMFDNTPPSGKPGVLMGFLGGHSWRQWMPRSPNERKQAVLADFAKAFGPAALKPRDYFEQDWTQEPWIRGGPVSVLGAGTTTDFLPILAQPFQRTHWAGTETSPYWNGYMDGAVRSGERAAKEVLDAL
ncbi:MAG: monoamine oxidase [Solirubrobacterales bacterium]|nr:monoamine oxidase [Solirubrobacterales bacterium]